MKRRVCFLSLSFIFKPMNLLGFSSCMIELGVCYHMKRQICAPFNNLTIPFLQYSESKVRKWKGVQFHVDCMCSGHVMHSVLGVLGETHCYVQECIRNLA